MVGEARAEGARFANPFRERFRCTEPRFSVFRIDLRCFGTARAGAGVSWLSYSRFSVFSPGLRQNREKGRFWTQLDLSHQENSMSQKVREFFVGMFL